MASLDKGKLISKLGYIAYFNEKVWGQIVSTAGNIYHAGDNVTLTKDVLTDVTVDEETGKTTKSGETTITIKAPPTFSSTAFSGANTSSGSILYSKPKALPTDDANGVGEGNVSHLKNINSEEKQYFTLQEEDIDNHAKTLGYDPKLVVADVLYACCFDVIKRLISIRPFTSTWTHESSVAGKNIYEKLNDGNYSYGVFIDNPSVKSSWTSNSGSGTWGQGGRLSHWQVTLGGSISALKLTETSVTRNGVYKGSVAMASRTVTMVTNFWNAWAERCKEKNRFDYKFFSCHLNCHSSCHSSCHGSRSRR